MGGRRMRCWYSVSAWSIRLSRNHFPRSYYGNLCRHLMATPAAASAVPAQPPIPGTLAKPLLLCALSVHVLTRLFLLEGRDLLEEMLYTVGASPVPAGGGVDGGIGSNGIPAASAAIEGGREPMGRCWHRVMLVPEEFTIDTLLQQQQQSRGVPDAGMGSGGASSLQNPARMHTGAGAASLGPAGSAEVQPASPLRPPRVPGSDTSLRSFQHKSMPDVTDDASPSSLLRPSECDGMVPEDSSNTSLLRRARFISNGGIDSANMLRLASGEGCGIMRNEYGAILF